MDSLLFRINPEKETAVLAIPEECVDKIITLYHKSLFVGHQGVIKTYLTISDKFFIPNIIHYLRSYIKGCHTCQLSRNEKLPTRYFQTRINANYVPMSRLSMDLKVMPKSHKGHKYILCVIDEVTNFLENPNYCLMQKKNPDIKVSRNFKEYYDLLNKRIKYLQDLLFNFKLQRLAMINNNRENFQYQGGDLVYIISPLTSQLKDKF